MLAMSTGDVRELPWAMLQAREKHPDSVLRSVPTPDVNGFLRTLAVNPLVDTSDSTVLKSVVTELRARHGEWILAAHLSMQAKRKHADIDPESTTRNGNGNSNRKKNRVASNSGGGGAGSAKARAAKKGRTTRSGADEDDLNLSGGKTRGKEPKIGAQCQAQVPKSMLPLNERMPEMTHVKSELVYSPEKCGSSGDSVPNGNVNGGSTSKPDTSNVSKFLAKLDEELSRRDGFGAAPTSEEKGLICLAKHGGDIDAAIRESMAQIGPGREFTAMGKAWTYEEKCLFVRAKAERGKDFEAMARQVFTGRKTSELIYMYYVYEKQQRMMHGPQVYGNVFDTGEELPKYLPKLGPERVTMAIRCLAKTAGDGFPADRRMEEAVRSVRQSGYFDANNRKRRKYRSTRSGRTFAPS